MGRLFGFVALARGVRDALRPDDLRGDARTGGHVRDRSENGANGQRVERVREDRRGTDGETARGCTHPY